MTLSEAQLKEVGLLTSAGKLAQEEDGSEYCGGIGIAERMGQGAFRGWENHDTVSLGSVGDGFYEIAHVFRAPSGTLYSITDTTTACQGYGCSLSNEYWGAYNWDVHVVREATQQVKTVEVIETIEEQS